VIRTGLSAAGYNKNLLQEAQAPIGTVGWRRFLLS